MSLVTQAVKLESSFTISQEQAIQATGCQLGHLSDYVVPMTNGHQHVLQQY
jgi:hypothetical protein